MKIPQEANKISWYQVINRVIEWKHSRSTLYWIYLVRDRILAL